MLHPDARALLDLMVEKRIPPVNELSPVEARAAYRDRRGFTQPDAPAVAESRDWHIDGPHGPIPLRLLRPQGSVPGELLPGLVYLHGGGWTIGDLDTHDVLCRELANLSGAVVVSVDYRLGPEAPFPAAVDDSLAAYEGVRREAALLGIDARRLAVGGDSAGGNLAAVVCLARRDAGLAPPAFQLLVYPATDQRQQAPSHAALGEGYLLTRDSMDYYRRHYLPDPATWTDWRASPLLHPDLSRLPPALVLTAGYDPLRDEGLAYAQRLTQAGSRSTHLCFERQIHGFITMGRVIAEANDAVRLCAAALRHALQP